MLRSLSSLAAASILCVASVSHAQKPALVQNVDERGRTPFQQTLYINPQFSPSNAGVPIACAGTVCAAYFNQVSAGSRLVIEYINVIYTSVPPVTSPLKLGSSSSQNASNPNQTQPLFFIPSTLPVGGDAYVILSAPTLYYVEAGQYPAMTISGIESGGGGYAYVTVTGYLVKL